MDGDGDGDAETPLSALELVNESKEGDGGVQVYEDAQTARSADKVEKTEGLSEDNSCNPSSQLLDGVDDDEMHVGEDPPMQSTQQTSNDSFLQNDIKRPAPLEELSEDGESYLEADRPSPLRSVPARGTFRAPLLINIEDMDEESRQGANIPSPLRTVPSRRRGRASQLVTNVYLKRQSSMRKDDCDQLSHLLRRASTGRSMLDAADQEIQNYVSSPCEVDISQFTFKSRKSISSEVPELQEETLEDAKEPNTSPRGNAENKTQEELSKSSENNLLGSEGGNNKINFEINSNSTIDDVLESAMEGFEALLDRCVLYGLDDCSPKGLENPRWHEIKTDTELQIQLRSWISSVQLHKSREYTQMFENLLTRFRALNSGYDRRKSTSRSVEVQTEYTSCCEEAWRLLLSSESHRSYIFDKFFQHILEDIVADMKPTIFWGLIPELQRAMLGLLWAASTHSVASEKLARETQLVEYLTEILAEFVRIGALKRITDRVVYLLGCLACLIRDPAACNRFSSGALTKLVQSLFDVIRKSQEYELPVYMDCTGRIMCHVLINDHAFRNHKYFQENTVGALIASLRFEDRIVSEPYFLCVSMVLLNFTLRSEFCREFLGTGQFASFLKSLHHVVEVLMHQQNFSKFSNAISKVKWQDLDDDAETKAPEDQRSHEFLLEGFCRSLCVIWACCKSDRGHYAYTQHECTYFYTGSCSFPGCASATHRTASRGNGDPVDGDEDNYSDIGDSDDEDEDSALGGRELDPSSWLDLPDDQVDDILVLCLRILHVDFLSKVLRKDPNRIGLSQGLPSRIGDLLDRIQAVAIAILTSLLHSKTGYLRLLETIEFTHFVRDLAQMLSKDTSRSLQRVVFTTTTGGEYLLQGKATISSAWNLLQLLTDIGVSCKYAFQHCRENIRDAIGRGVDKAELRRLADIAHFSRSLMITLGLDNLVEHVITVGSLLEDESEDLSDEDEMPGSMASQKSTKSLFKEKVHHIVRSNRVKALRAAAERLKSMDSQKDLSAVDLKGVASAANTDATAQGPSVTQSLQVLHAAQSFLKRMTSATASTHDARLVVVKMCTLTAACALVREPQESIVLRKFVDLTNVALLKGDAYTALWLLARNVVSNRNMGQVGAVETALRDAALFAELRTSTLSRILLLLWLLLYQTSNLQIFAQNGGFNIIYKIVQASISRREDASAQHHGYLGLQILRVCSFYAGDSAKISSDLLERSSSLLKNTLQWACDNKLPARTRCTAASLLLQMPLPDETAEKTAVALIRCFMGESDPTFRVYAGQTFAYIQFSAQGHRLLRKVRIPRRFLRVAATVCDQIEKTPADKRVCTCPYGTRRSKLCNRCATCNRDAEMQAALMALLYLSNNPQNQVVLCREGLHTTLRMAWVFESGENRALVKSLLSRWAAHPNNRAQLYELELQARQAMHLHFDKGLLKTKLGSDGITNDPLGSVSAALSDGPKSQILDREKRAFMEWFLKLNTKVAETSDENPDEREIEHLSQNMDESKDPSAQKMFIPQIVAKQVHSKSPGSPARSPNHNRGSMFLQGMRESRAKLWKQSNTSDLDTKTDPWNPQISSIRSDGEVCTVTVKNQFPHDRMLFKNKKTSTMPLTREERDIMGMCQLSLFPHIDGAVVYLQMNMKPHIIVGPDLSNQNTVFLYKSGGSQISMQSASSDLDEVFGVPRPPVSLFDGDLCYLQYDNPAYRALEVSQLVDFELLPKKVQAPHPEGYEKVDVELSQNTDFPLMVHKRLPLRKLRTMSIQKLQSVLHMNSHRSSLQNFLSIEIDTVFHTRKLESDSRSFFSCVDESCNRAFEKDWSLLMQRNGFNSYIQSIAVRDSTDKGKMDANVPAMLAKIKAFLKENYGTVCAIYRFYSGASMVRGTGFCQNPPDVEGECLPDVRFLDCIPIEGILQFTKDIQILSRVQSSILSKEGLKRLSGNIFARGIQRKDLTRNQRLCMKRCKAYNFGRFRAVHRFGFLELIVRSADAKYSKEDNTTTNKSMVIALGRLFKENLEPLIKSEKQIDADDYRRTRLYKVRINEILKDSEPQLQQLFSKFAGTMTDSRSWGGLSGRRMTLPEWCEVVDAIGVLSPRLELREAAMIFKQSIFEVEDVAQDWEHNVTLTYTGFLEAFCRLADAFYLPTDALLSKWHLDDALDFYRFIGRLGISQLFFAAEEKVSFRECVNDFTVLSRWSGYQGAPIVQLHYKLNKLIELVSKQYSPTASATAELFLEDRFWLRHVSETSNWDYEDRPENQFERRVALRIYGRLGLGGGNRDFSLGDSLEQLRCLQAVRLPCMLLRQSFQQKCDDDLLLHNYLDYVSSGDFFNHLKNDIKGRYDLSDFCPLDIAISETIATYLDVVKVESKP